MKMLKKFIKIAKILISQTGKNWVLKTVKNAIFMNFLAARAQATRVEFCFNDLERKNAKKLYRM
jgi:hypothetical protein